MWVCWHIPKIRLFGGKPVRHFDGEKLVCGVSVGFVRRRLYPGGLRASSSFGIRSVAENQRKSMDIRVGSAKFPYVKMVYKRLPLRRTKRSNFGVHGQGKLWGAVRVPILVEHVSFRAVQTVVVLHPVRLTRLWGFGARRQSLELAILLNDIRRACNALRLALTGVEPSQALQMFREIRETTIFWISVEK